MRKLFGIATLICSSAVLFQPAAALARDRDDYNYNSYRTSDRRDEHEYRERVERERRERERRERELRERAYPYDRRW